MATIKRGEIPAITQEILSKLATKGYQRVADFISAPPEKITAVSGLPHKKVIAIRRIILAQFASYATSGNVLYEESLNTTSVLSTSCGRLDELLSGGVYTGEITEITGASSSGKTQLCMSLATHIAMEFKKRVLYVDSTGGCSPRRFADMVNKRIATSCTPSSSFSSILSRIRIVKCCDLEDFSALLTELEEDMKLGEDEFANNLKCLIVDSITPLLMPLFFTHIYMQGNAAVQEVSSRLHQLCHEHKIACVVVNDQVKAGFSDQLDVTEEEEGRRRALGAGWRHVCPVTLLLTSCSQPPAGETVTKARLLNSKRIPPQPDATVKLKIASQGVVDCPDDE